MKVKTRIILTAIMLTAIAAATASAQDTQNSDTPSSRECEQALQETRYFMARSGGGLSDQATREAERRLQIARAQCAHAPKAAMLNLQKLREDMGMAQSAQSPKTSPGTE